jgi:hypothetical protein
MAYKAAQRPEEAGQVALGLNVLGLTGGADAVACARVRLPLVAQRA